MNKQQQELYEKLLKKVNEYCLGYAAEDVIAAIDALVEDYEKKIACDDFVLTGFKYYIGGRTVTYGEISERFKALEIIKEHRLDIDWFLQFVTQDISYKHYVYCVEQGDNKFAKRFLLTEQEYELLKEILK